MAQLVEHNLAKVGVAGSNPVVRSQRNRSSGALSEGRLLASGPIYRAFIAQSGWAVRSTVQAIEELVGISIADAAEGPVVGRHGRNTLPVLKRASLTQVRSTARTSRRVGPTGRTTDSGSSRIAPTQ